MRGEMGDFSMKSTLTSILLTERGGGIPGLAISSGSSDAFFAKKGNSPAFFVSKTVLETLSNSTGQNQFFIHHFLKMMKTSIEPDFNQGFYLRLMPVHAIEVIFPDQRTF